MPSICTGGSQTAAIRIWFRSTSSPIGYSRKLAGRRVLGAEAGACAGGGASASGSAASGPCPGIGPLEIQVEHQDRDDPAQDQENHDRADPARGRRVSSLGGRSADGQGSGRERRGRSRCASRRPGRWAIVAEGRRGGARPTRAGHRPAAVPGPRRPGCWGRDRPAGTRHPARPGAWSGGCRRSGARTRRCRRRSRPGRRGTGRRP